MLVIYLLFFYSIKTHENPIFYKINLPVFKILKKDEEITLGHGHYFSLLPKQYVYEIRVTDTNLAGNQDTPTTSSNSQIINETDQNHNVKIDTSSPNSSSSSGTITFTVDTNDQMPQTSTSPFKTKRPANGECNEESTKKLKINEHFQKEIKIKPDPDAPVDQNVIPVCTVFPLIKPDPNGPSTSTSSVTTTVTSVKIEPPSSTVKSETVSTDNNASSDNPPRRARSVCEFGIRCYRMQTEHRRDHAHPGDADYRRPDFLPAPNDAPDCEYGASCYRRNPSHFVGEFK